jgi:hypothetical protein
MAILMQKLRAQDAWVLLLASPDVDAPGAVKGVAQAAGVTTQSVRNMRHRLHHLRVQGRALTGAWVEDMRDASRLETTFNKIEPLTPRTPRLVAEERAARKAVRLAEREVGEKAQAIAIQAEAAARHARATVQYLAEAAAMKQRWVEAKAARDAVPID